jgi:hypothetical protein
MAMVNRPRDFRHHDVIRAIRAARAAGIDSPSVRIRTPGGTEYYFGGGEVKEAPPKKSTPLRAKLAEGGSQHMVPKQAAGPAKAGQMGKQQTAAPGTKGATGGTARFTPSKAVPAKAGQVGTDSVRPVGGAARPARAGECGT